MKKQGIISFLFAAALLVAGTQVGMLDAQAANRGGKDQEDRWEHKWDDDAWEDKWEDKWGDEWEDKWGDKWEDKWEDKWDDDDWDDDHDDDWDDDHDDDDDWDDDDRPNHTYGGMVNVVYFCKETNSVWANGEIWVEGLVDGKGNVNSSLFKNIPKGYELRVVGDYYYDGSDELRVEIVPKHTYGGMVNVVYFCKETNSVWANGEIWVEGLVDGKGNVNSSLFKNIPKGYELRVVGDYYYDGSDELRVEIVPKHTYGGMVNVVYFCKETNSVWANGEIWAEDLVDGKGNVNSSEMTTIPAGYKLKIVGDYYYDGGDELRVEVVPVWFR